MGKAGEKFRPSNGTEGCFFEDKFCSQCRNEKFMHTQDTNDKQCDILNDALTFDLDEEKYPKEWTYDEAGDPTCTAYVHKVWEFDINGKETNPEEEEEETLDPNQLDLFKTEEK